MRNVIVALLSLLFAGLVSAQNAIIEVNDHYTGLKTLWVDCEVDMVVGYDNLAGSMLSVDCNFSHTSTTALPSFSVIPYKFDTFDACSNGGSSCIFTRSDCYFVGEFDLVSGTRIITVSCIGFNQAK